MLKIKQFKKIKRKYKFIGMWLDIMCLSVLIHLTLFMATKDFGVILPFIAGAIPSFYLCMIFQIFIGDE